MKKSIRKTFALTMTATTLLAVPAASIGVSAVENTDSVQTANQSNITYTENHSVIDCANYYKENSSYKFLIKIPKGAPTNRVTITEHSGNGAVNMADSLKVTYQYTDSTSDFYMYTVDIYPGCPKYMWYGYGIKLYYDNGDEHYMATNTSNNSITEGPGYNLGTVL